MTVRNYQLIKSLDSLKGLIDKLWADDRLLGFDLETGYLGPDREKGALDIDWDSQFITGFSIANDLNAAWYVPVAHDHGANLPEEKTWELMQPLLETLPSVAHNAKFEIRNLRSLERKGRGPRIELNITGDSQLDSYVLSETPFHGLKELVDWQFGHQMATLKSVFPSITDVKARSIRFNILELTPEVTSYACEDALWCLALYMERHPKAEQTRSFILKMEEQILKLLCDMEDGGHAVDWESMREAYVHADPFYDEMQKAARTMLGKMAGEDFSNLNLNSSPQMAEALYGKIGLRTNRTSKKTGNPSTDKIALERLSREHPAVKKVLESREVRNLANRLKKWTTQYVTSHDGRVHASFNQVVVPSGRFSANDPAVQQLPKEWRWSTFPKVNPWDDEHWSQVQNHERAIHGKHYWQGNFRDFMVSDSSGYLMGFDYSQIELRCLAGMSGEPSLLEAFNNDEDIHIRTASMMLGKPVEEITDKDRAIGKTMNFALVYGMGEDSLADRLAITIEEAERLYAQYFSAFTLVTGWMEDKKRTGLEYGFVETHFGRKVTLWDLQSDNAYIRSKGARLCVNAPVQGTAADMMKLAMLRAKKTLENKGWWGTKVRMVNNIHDALVFDVDNSVNPNELRQVLSAAVVWDEAGFPKIKADWELGHRWGSGMKKWKDTDPVWHQGQWIILDGEPAEAHDDDLEEPVEEEAIEKVSEISESKAVPVIVVEMSAQPTSEGWGKFVSLLQENPGATVVRVKVPEGEIELEKYPTSLSAGDQGRISLLLGGAKVYAEEDVDMDKMAEGMTL